VAGDKDDESGADGHRARLRARFRNGGADAMPDYELLEMTLFAALPRRDTKPLAKALLARFGSFAEVIAAPRARLMEVKGVGESVANHLKIVEAAAHRLAKTKVMGRPALSSWTALLDYCTTAMARSQNEEFRVLFLVIRLLRASAFISSPGRSFTWRMRLPSPSSRPAGSASIAP
jgi:DNA repair protein RadC